MTNTHPRAGRHHGTGRSPADRRPRAGQAEGGSLGAYFGGPSGTPFGARHAGREENPLSAPGSARELRRHNPFLSSLLSVVEEIIGFRGPDALPGRTRPPAAAAACRAAGRERR
ncbi:hypothetical protein GCM10010284_66190 [Streptomyces rubiginosohelvolus]|nr:hypothetical protein GCM10010284_66190 [Streptomyces rubiginosohelvolus]